MQINIKSQDGQFITYLEYNLNSKTYTAKTSSDISDALNFHNNIPYGILEMIKKENYQLVFRGKK